MDITGNALIFGGGGGIGRATALAFAEAGAAGLLIADLDLEAAKTTASEATAASKQRGFRVEAVAVDVTYQESVESVVKQMVDSFGRIDYCVTCAGVPVRTPAPIADQLVDEFINTQNVNVNGTFFVLRAVLGIMRHQESKPNFPNAPTRGSTRGSVVAMGSALSINAGPYFTQYTTSKHAVLGLVKTAALDSVKEHIRVNCVCPTWVESNMTQQLRQIEGMGGDAMAASVPMGRLGAAEEVADAVLFLCSPRASLITGSSLVADGGQTVKIG
ncbi:Uu.00g013250.m01.CDS01 [Anthostomella pinea]|uniref:Uu.00g013250.m01.CDS01 n=1 Tax=Anthostomella pinea TaxID=933095 RepID=A0AAI8YQC3_9PEZI|nr:Uu.00g013250.m01.CDS01 [Anthostomella pinea]